MVLTAPIRLLVARIVWIVLAAAPAALVTHANLGSGPGVSPWFTDVHGRLPLVHLLRLFRALPALAPVLGVAMLLAILGNQLLTASALSVFLGQDGAGVFSRARVHGGRHLGPFLRILLLGVAASILAASILGFLFDALGHASTSRGWTAATTLLVLPALRVLLLAVALAKIGAWLACARALTVADRRSRVRRTALLALRLCWRAKLRWVVPFVGATIATTVAAGAILAAWLQNEPRGVALALWLALWILMLAAQAAVWLWLVHGAAQLVSHPLAADLRSRPDAPLWPRRRPHMDSRPKRPAFVTKSSMDSAP
jgi:hypothetical protein